MRKGRGEKGRKERGKGKAGSGEEKGWEGEMGGKKKRGGA